jgi:hypothetical protein
MPDITLCTNHQCDRRKDCYRYMAEPCSKWQGYSCFGALNYDRPCPYFTKIMPGDTLRDDKETA